MTLLSIGINPEKGLELLSFIRHQRFPQTWPDEAFEKGFPRPLADRRKIEVDKQQASLSVGVT